MKVATDIGGTSAEHKGGSGKEGYQSRINKRGEHVRGQRMTAPYNHSTSTVRQARQASESSPARLTPH